MMVALFPLVSDAAYPGVAWRTNLDAAKLEAAQSGRLLLLHFTTKTCGPCKVLDKQVFNQPQVGEALERDYVPVRIDADNSPALARMYRVDEVPMEFIATPDGNPLYNPRIPNSPEPYVTQLQNMARHFRQTAQAEANPAVNSAYAALPTAQPTSPAAVPSPFAAAGQPTAPAAHPAGSAEMALSPSSPYGTPQTQANPYFVAATPPAATAAVQPSAGTSGAAAAPAAPAQATPGQFAATSNPQLPLTSESTTAGMPMAGPLGSSAAPPAAVGAGAGATPAFASAPVQAAGPGSANFPADTTGTPSYPTTEALLAAPAAQPAPATSDLPAGSPPKGFDGYCPVTLKALKRWAPGDVKYGVVHRGRTYLFVGPEQRDQFMADPDAYSPVFAGLDPVLLIDQQQSIEGSRRYGYEYGGAFYLFSSKETMQKFASAPHAYAAGVRQAMTRIDAGNGVIRR